MGSRSAEKVSFVRRSGVRRPEVFLGKAEVEELGARPGQHDVSGLKVAMHDTLAMRLVECVGNFNADA
jgi:hypothetical protein